MRTVAVTFALGALVAAAILTLSGCGEGASDTSAAPDMSGHVYWVSSGVGAVMTVNGGHVTTLARGQSGPASVAVDGTHVYWVNNRAGTVNKVPLAGGRGTVLAHGQNGPVSVAVDSGHVYWVDSGADNDLGWGSPDHLGTVDEVPLRGGRVTTLARGQSHPTSLAVNSSHVYWVDQYHVSLPISAANYTGTVNEVPLGGGRVTVLAHAQELPRSVAVDSSHVYWVNGGGCRACGEVKEAPIGGGRVTTLANGQNTPISVAVNGGHVYWIGRLLGTVSEVSLGGGRVTTLVRGQNGPVSLAVDDTHIYWVDYYDGTVNEIPLEGGLVTTLAQGQNGPGSIAVGPEHAARNAGSIDSQGAIHPAGSIAADLPTGMIGSIADGPTGAFGPTGDYGPGGQIRLEVPRIGPILLSASGLKAEAKLIGQRIYWAGPQKGLSYEFTRDTSGDVYVRYLPEGVTDGTPGAQFLIVATYPFDSAYETLKQWGSDVAPGPGRSLVYAKPDDPSSALIAFRRDCPKSLWAQGCGLPYQIELYDPAPAVSAKAAVESGQVKVLPVG
jgi:hypothetical protein